LRAAGLVPVKAFSQASQTKKSVIVNGGQASAGATTVKEYVPREISPPQHGHGGILDDVRPAITR
jgi:hypothetical protein